MAGPRGLLTTQIVPVREEYHGQTVWEGVVHVFDLASHPTATGAYAWSSPVEGSTNGGSSPCFISRQSIARRLPCLRHRVRVSRQNRSVDDRAGCPHSHAIFTRDQ
jgi:hypothetical protein